MAHLRAPPRLPSSVSRLADRLVRAGDPLPARGRPRTGADGRRHQRDRRRRGHADARARDRGDRRSRARPRGAHVRATHHLRTAGARRRVRPSRRAVLALPPALIRLLRPQPDGPADVAGDDRPPGRPLLPRLRAHLLRATPGDDRRGHGRLVPLQLEARVRRARDHADRRRRGVPVAVAAGAAEEECSRTSQRSPSSRRSRSRASTS